MSENKQLNQEQLEAVTGGTNEGLPTFSNEVGFFDICVNQEIYVAYSYIAGGFTWFKAKVLDFWPEETYGQYLHYVKVQVVDQGNSINSVGEEFNIKTEGYKMFTTKLN